MKQGSLDGSELGHAKLFAENFKELIYLQSMKSEGYFYNESSNIWELKENSRFIIEVNDFLTLEVLKNKNKDSMRDILKIVRTRKHALAVWELAKTYLIDKEFHTKMNKAPNYLPLKDGKIINLKSLKVRDRTKEDYFDFELPFEFDKKQITEATRFFSEIMNNDDEITNYLQMHLGYCITGETNLRNLYIFWGAGANGKSSLCELLKSVMNKFYVTASKKVFIKQEGGSSHTSHLIPLMNARLAVLSETEEGDTLNAGTIKNITGNDEISARQLYGVQFSFKPFAKYIMLTNHKPVFDINDKAMIDRIKYIPFKARFTVEPKGEEIKRDTEFIDSLMTENLNEVFNWLCIGANKYYKSKGVIPLPAKLLKATNEYINELDSTADFINSKCKATKDSKIKRNELYDKYKVYCQENGLDIVRDSQFYKRLEMLEYESVKVNGVRCIKGLEMIVNYI
jgi:putative DNA primase/helicase